MSTTRYLAHPSGGLAYHLRAWRYRGTLWLPYLEQVADWLQAWRPATRHLVLIGPSAGYSLSAGFLDRFERISAMEPDILARVLLRQRFPGVRFDFRDALGDPRDLPRNFPDAAYLFCNLLGQEWTTASRNTWQPALVEALNGQPWASYHDLVSTVRQPRSYAALSLPALISLDDLLGHFWPPGELHLHDHETHGLLPHRPRRYAIWQLTPDRVHLVEWLQG